jgi:transposase
MATLTRKIKKGRPYYYAVAYARVGGKPRIVWQKYLGTLETILARADQTTPPAPREAVIFEAGGVAALLRLAQRLGLPELINEILPKRDQGPTVAHYLLLAAINRALDPCSKLAIGDWYEQTVLCRLWRFPKSAFSSQRFWDHMDLVSPAAIQAIQDKLLPRVQSAFGIDARLLLYDTTNFFTFISSTNTRADLAQRGHSKAKRHDLRQIGLALLVTQQFQIPLLHRTYPGNVPDVSLFPRLAREMIAHYGQWAGPGAQATLVFDKGNVSDDGMEELVVAGVHFVAALCANRLPELLAWPLEGFAPLGAMPGTRAHTTTTDLFGRTCRVVVTYTESFFTQQLSGVTQNLVRCQKKLLDLEKSLAQWHKGKASSSGRRLAHRAATKCTPATTSSSMPSSETLPLSKTNVASGPGPLSWP